MKKLLLLTVLFLSEFCSAQVAFFKLFGGDEYDFGHDIVQVADSGYLITGASGSFREGHADAFLLKIDKYGNYQWSAPYGGPENDGANEMLYIENYGIYLIGRSNSWSQNFDMDFYLAFTDNSGSLIWEKTFEGEDWEEGVEAALTSDSGMVVGINRFGDNTNGQDISLMRLDASGDTVWTKNYALPGDDEITCIESYQDSLFLVTSNRLDTATNYSIAYLMMLHEDGTIIFEDTLASNSGIYKINDFFVTNDTLYAIGSYEQDDTTAADLAYYRYKIDPQNPQQIQVFAIHSADPWYGDVITNYYGSSTRRYGAYRVDGAWTTPGGPDLHMGRHSYILGWEAGLGYVETEGEDRMYEGIPTLDGGAVFVGYIADVTGGASVAVSKIGPGEVYPTMNGVTYVFQLVGVEELKASAGVHVYPNPATDAITVSSQDVSITNYEIFSMNGIKLQKGVLSDTNEIKLNLLAEGIYAIRLFNENEIIGTVRVVVR